ncbi:MAG: H-type small acid-soluble spore protein [Brevibacillus sp.]|nr:H-type small acid-soluble spore protein [Brevibacillus sp.]
MDLKRAQEILKSPEKIVVEHAGVPVWIDGIDENSKMARVHTEGNPQDTRTVAVSELAEK